MGKYSHLKQSLESAPVDQSYQQRVEEKKREYMALDMGGLAKRYALERDMKEKLEDEVKEHNLAIEALSQILVARLESQHLTQFRHETAGLLSIKDEPYVQVADRQTFFAWVREKGMDDLFTVNYQTASAMAKSLLSDGMPLPPGLKAFMKSSISRRKS